MKSEIYMLFMELKRKVKIFFAARLLGLSFRFKLTKIPVLPVAIDLEPTNLCNLKCSHCPNPYWTKKKTNLTLAQFSQVIGQFPNLSYIKLQGIGEPFLNPELISMFFQAEKLGISTGVITNGMIYNERISKDIKSLKKTKIRLSIDAVSDVVLQKVRTGSNINIIKKNIANLRIDNELLGGDISIWSVPTSENIAELSEIIGFARENNIRKVTFQMFLNDWFRDDIRKVTLYQEKETVLDYQSALTKAEEKAAKENIELDLFRGNYYSQNNKCPLPFKSAFIDVYGNVVPCSNISDADVICMGNVFEKPFREIWNSDEYVSFRHDIIIHNIRDYCKKCYSEPAT